MTTTRRRRHDGQRELAYIRTRNRRVLRDVTRDVVEAQWRADFGGEHSTRQADAVIRAGTVLMMVALLTLSGGTVRGVVDLAEDAGVSRRTVITASSWLRGTGVRWLNRHIGRKGTGYTRWLSPPAPLIHRIHAALKANADEQSRAGFARHLTAERNRRSQTLGATNAHVGSRTITGGCSVQGDGPPRVVEDVGERLAPDVLARIRAQRDAMMGWT